MNKDVIIETLNPSELKRNKRRRRKERIRSFIKEYLKSKNCVSCGTINNLTFHHRDPTQKKDDIGKLVSYKSLSKVQREIDKCDVLCRHCHDVKHNMSSVKKNDNKEVDICGFKSSVKQDIQSTETTMTCQSTHMKSYVTSSAPSVVEKSLGTISWRILKMVQEIIFLWNRLTKKK